MKIYIKKITNQEKSVILSSDKIEEPKQLTFSRNAFGKFTTPLYTLFENLVRLSIISSRLPGKRRNNGDKIERKRNRKRFKKSGLKKLRTLFCAME